MKMTLSEALSCPNGMSIEAWGKELEKRQKMERRLYKLSIKRDELEDALDVLADEECSERWKRKREELDKVNADIEKLKNKLDA